jgi:hypothetical protein
MSAAIFALEGKIPFSASGEPAETWYKLKVISDLSNQTQSPLIGLHGGPGKPQATLIDRLLISVRYMAHDHLIPLGDLSATRPIILCDQIGNTRSTHFSDPPNPAKFWTIDLFVEEL